VRALRRAALAAAEQGARRRWLPLAAPALTGAAAVCCLVVALGLWRVVSPAPDGSGEDDQVRGQAAEPAVRESAAAAPGEPAAGAMSGDPAPAGAAASALPERRLGPSRRARPRPPGTASLGLVPTRSVTAAAVEIAGHVEAPGPAEDVARTEIAAVREETPGAAAAPGAEPLVARAPDAAAAAPGLKLQFSTPGGTRIIWVLTSESES
jgi:hypothetical protein